MPSTTNLEGQEIVDAPGKNDNASMPEQVKRPNPWRRRMMKKMMMMIMVVVVVVILTHKPGQRDLSQIEPTRWF
jgi:hypothetical protein